jgi:putative ABC transport system ATP-binding protein
MIKIKGITKSFTMGNETVHALAGIDLDVKHNEFVAIMGPSGSGKSTLMNMLGCLDRPDTGEYWLDDQLVSTLEDGAMAKIRNQKIGFVFQTFHLLPRMTATQNVALPLLYSHLTKSEATEKSLAALQSVGLDNRANHRPNEMSGGQRQRVAIARALVNQPKILFADEPTGNLDSKTSHDIMTLIQGLHQSGQTIVLVTHEEDIAKYAQKVIHMRDGRIERVQVN